MATPFKRTLALGVAGLLAASLTTACGTFEVPAIPGVTGDPAVGAVSPAATPAAPATANAAPNARAVPARSAVVKRGAITESLSFEGLVAPRQEVPITYQGSGKVLDVKVKPNQMVSQGDVLVELDAVELARSLDAAQARFQTSKANLAQAQAQMAAQQRTAAQRAAVASTQQQQAIEDAESGLRKAQENLATVMAGAPEADRHAAESNLAAAQATLQRAQAAQDKLNGGPDPGAVRVAQSELANAQIAADRAKAELDALTRGPDPIAVSAAQREVDRAQTQVQLAEAIRIDPKAPDQTSARLTRDNALADARLALQLAQDRLTKLQQPPSQIDVQAARQKLLDAQNTLGVAQDRLDAFSQPAEQSDQDAAQGAIDIARRAVTDAQARLAAVNSRPTAAEAADARDRVRRAEAALTAARANAAADSTGDPGGVDFTSLEEAVNQDQAAVTSLQKQLDNSRITAPLTGLVVSVKAKPGDTITSARPVIIMAEPLPAIVRVDLADDEATRIKPGLDATIDLADASSSAPTAPISGTVSGVTPPVSNGTGGTADVSVAWPTDMSPKLGTSVQVNVTVQQKDNVLVVPKKAVRTARGRSSVEVLDGSLRKLTPVEVGVSSADAVEIVTGLQEGQLVQVNF